jgi:excisionase family DNA binding protein
MRKPNTGAEKSTQSLSAICSIPEVDVCQPTVKLLTTLVESFDQIRPDIRRIADSSESQNRTVISALPPEALSMKDAAQFLGVEVPAIKELVRTRKLPYVQYGSQRGRMFLVEDLRAFLKKYRRADDERMSSMRRRV